MLIYTIISSGKQGGRASDYVDEAEQDSVKRQSSQYYFAPSPPPIPRQR